MTPKDLRQVYAANRHDAQIGGETDGIGLEVARDLGYETPDEAIAHIAEWGHSHGYDVYDGLCDWVEIDPDHQTSLGHEIPVHRRNSPRYIPGPIPGESEGEREPEYFCPPPTIDPDAAARGIAALHQVRQQLHHDGDPDQPEAHVIVTPIVMPPEAPLTYNQLVLRERRSGEPSADLAYDPSENM